MKYFSHSLQGKRPSNEDQHYSFLNLESSNEKFNNINFIGVFDGHGGKTVSRYLKDNLPLFFINKFPSNILNNNKKTINYINQVYNLIQNNLVKNHPRAAQYCGSTTLCGIIFKDKLNKKKLWVFNSGDSRAVMCNKSDKPVQLTIDHKPNMPDERKRIESLGGKIVFDGYDWRIKDLSLSRSVGDIDCTTFVTHIPQIYKYNLNKNDKFIIFACDGLWDVLTNKMAVDYVNGLIKSNYNGNLAKALAEFAYNRGSTDNITATILFI
jgi:serine/threonine protein phosphatase PrpC